MSIDTATLSIAVDSSGVRSATNAIDRMADSATSLEGILKKVLAVIGVMKIAELAKETALAAARYETLGVAMNRVGLNAGYTSTQMAQFQAGLQATGISALEARNNLARMAAAQLDITKSSQLARVAQDAAVLADINSSEAFERLVQGIVSGQPRILHTMGIFADFGAEEKKWADAHGTTMEALSQADKVQIRLNATLTEGAKRAGVYEDAMGTAGKQIRSMERFVSDLEVQIGKSFGEALTSGVARFATGLKDCSNAMEAWEKSGGQGVFAMKLKDDFVALTNVLVNATGWVIKHADSILVLAGAYAGFKLAGWIMDLGRWVTVQVSAVQAHIAATAAAYNHANTITKAALAEAGYTYSVNQSNAAQIAEAQTMLVHNALAIQNAVATGAMTEAEAVLARAGQTVIATKLEEAAAIETSNAAQGAASVALGGVSGGLTVLLSLIGAAVAAWLLFRDTTKEASSDASKFMDERIKRADEHLEKMKRFWAALKPGTSASQAESQSWSALDDPASQKGMENIRNYQAALGKMDAEWQRVSKQMGVSESASEILKDKEKGQWIDAGLLELAKKRVQAQQNLNDAVAHEQRLVEALNNEHAQSDFKERAMIGMNATKATVPGKAEGGAGTEYGLTDYGREIQRLGEELTKLTVSERAAYVEKLKLMDNGAGGDTSKAMGLWDAITARKTLEVENHLLEENLKLLLKKKEINESINPFKAYKRDTQGMDPLGEEAQRIESQKAALEQWKGVMPLESYTRALQNIRLAELRLKAESGQTWAIIGDTIAQNAGAATDAMVSWMNKTDGLARTWESLGDTVRNVIADMCAQMQKAIIQQQLMQPLMNGLGSAMGTMGDGQGWASWAAEFSKGWGGGKAVGGDVYSGTTYLVGERGPELFTPGVSGTITPNHAIGGQTTIDSKIVVNVQSDGTINTKVTSSNANAMAQDLQRSVEPMVLQVIAKHMRPGGRLNPVAGGGIA